MSRMSGPKRKKTYEFLAHRDHERCFIGGEPGNNSTLVIDHADNDNSNNNPENLHLMCSSMNAAKNPRGRGRKKMSSMRMSAPEELSKIGSAEPSSAQLKKNQQAEPDFRHWLFLEIWRKGKLLLDDVIDSGAAQAGCSQDSIKRYLRKECSRVRIYDLVQDLDTKEKFVQLKSEWEQHRKKEEEQRADDCRARNWEKDDVKVVPFKEKDSTKKLDEEKKGVSDERTPTQSAIP